MSIPSVDVVILNYNTRDILAKCLPQVLKYSQQDNVRIVLVDNASTDDSVSFVKNTFGNAIEIIQHEQNYGFAGGYNKALTQCNADYFLLLNSDAEPANELWIDELIQLAAQYPQLGAAQPSILDYHNRNKFEYAGANGGFLDLYGFPFCRGRIFGNVETNEQQYTESVPLFWASGAALFIKREVWEQAQGLDIQFFAHMEEIDLCWRIQLLGYEIKSCPKSEVYHIGGATLSNHNPRKTFLNFRNGLMMLHKNLPESERSKKILQRKLFDALAGVFFLLQGKPKHTLQIIRAHREYDQLKTTLLPSANAKPLKSLVGILKGSLVFHYFFLGKKTWSALRF
jgi:GT2 family glycosyltransferase